VDPIPNDPFEVIAVSRIPDCQSALLSGFVTYSKTLATG
jgi:hypothetical protein